MRMYLECDGIIQIRYLFGPKGYNVNTVFSNILLFVKGSSTPPHVGEVMAAGVESPTQKQQADVVTADPKLEKRLLDCLCDTLLVLPVDSRTLTNGLVTKVSSLYLSNHLKIVQK